MSKKNVNLDEQKVFEEIILQEGVFNNIKKHFDTYKKDRNTPVLSNSDAFHQSLDEIPQKHIEHYTNYLASKEGQAHASYIAQSLPDSPSPSDYRDRYRRLAREYKRRHNINEETEAAKTLRPNSKTGMMANIMSGMNGMSKTDMIDFFDQVMSQYGPNIFPGAENVNNAEQNQASIAAKGSVSVKEDVAEMFEGEEITEDFRLKVETLFEAAVNAKLQLEIAALEEETENEFTSLVEEYKEEITDKVNEYLTYAVEEWVKENKLALENGLKLEIFESFFKGLKNLFLENNVSIPDNEVSLVGDLETKIAGLEEKINESINREIALKNTINELTKDKILMKISEGLSENQKEKFLSLSEGVEFESAEKYEEKLNIVKETYFSNKSKTVVQEEIQGVDTLNENESVTSKPVGQMAIYADAISRTVKNR